MSRANIPKGAVQAPISARNKAFRLMAGLAALILCMAADGSWLKHVPDADRQRVNPYAGVADAAAAGSKLFADHCSK
jgi:mono/diheme cytochrome c family protein